MQTSCYRQHNYVKMGHKGCKKSSRKMLKRRDPNIDPCGESCLGSNHTVFSPRQVLSIVQCNPKTRTIIMTLYSLFGSVFATALREHEQCARKLIVSYTQARLICFWEMILQYNFFQRNILGEGCLKFRNALRTYI